jgi:hypothetical protein
VKRRRKNRFSSSRKRRERRNDYDFRLIRNSSIHPKTKRFEEKKENQEVEREVGCGLFKLEYR